MAADRRLCRQHSQGRQACGLAGRAVEQVRAGHQQSDRHHAQPDRPAIATRYRRRGDRMRRREFITLISGATAAWPLATRAQQDPLPVIGFMSSRTPEDSQTVLAAFRKGISESGLVEGKNVVMEFRWARGDFGRLPAFATEFVSKRVAVIVA